MDTTPVTLEPLSVGGSKFGAAFGGTLRVEELLQRKFEPLISQYGAQ